METQSRDGLSWRVILLSVVFATLGAWWIRKASLIAFTILVGEGTPPVPALTALVLMTGAAFAFRSLQRTGRWRREALLVYITLTLVFITIDANGIRQLLSTLTSLRYFAAPGNDYQMFADVLPAWLAPTSETAIRGFYEGGENGAIPWRDWTVPGLAWGGLFMVFSLSLVCLGVLFRRPWAEHEKLSFPLAELALRLAPETPQTHGERHLLRQPIFWVGFGVAALYNGSNIAHAFAPGVVAVGQAYDFSALLTERPWTALRPLNMSFRPEMIGLGYLVPVDVLFSVWFFYLLFRFENLGAELTGYQVAGFPFERAQAMGSYVGLAVLILWTARKHLRQVFAAALGRAAIDDSQEALPYRIAFWGLLAGILAVSAFFVAAGMNVGLAAAYTLLMYLMALVYGRIRAQTGLPVTYGIPREDTTDTLYALQTASGHLTRDELRSETAFTVSSVLVRMTFGQLGAFELEGLRLGDWARLRRKQLLFCLAFGVLLGLLLAGYLHLQAAYSYGWNVIDGGSNSGGYRTSQALSTYQRLQTRAFTRVPMETSSNLARVVGFVLTVVMMVLRAKFLRFPLNPVGMALAGVFGGPIWFPIFVAWLLKTLILRIGGAHTYRQLTPAFLGLALGQFFLAGGVWGLVGAFNEEVAKRYLLWFA